MAAPLAISELGVTVGGRMLLAPLTASFHPGLTLIVGPNGAGKSTLLKAMLGLLPASGQVEHAGVSSMTLAPRVRARAIAYLPQGHEAHWPISVRAVVALGRYPHGASDPDRLSEVDARAVSEAMALADVNDLAGRIVTTLSGGERARVALARVLAVEAPVMLCDEPTAALDPGHQLGVMELLKRRATAGATVLGVTHDLALAARFADRVLLLDGGCCVADGVAADVLTPQNLQQVYGIEVFTTVHRGESVLVPWARQS